MRYKTHAYSEDLSPSMKMKKLAEIKKFAKTWFNAWNENNRAFDHWKSFAYKSNIDDAQETVLNLQNKTPIEINLIENFLSRLVGEFSMAEFGITVAATDGVIDMNDGDPTQMDEQELAAYEKEKAKVKEIVDRIEAMDGHARHFLYEAKKAQTEYRCYMDILSGMVAGKVYTRYKNKRDFEQEVMFEHIKDPTLCGWDITAEHPDKRDGKACYQIIPVTWDELKGLYDIKDDKLKNSRIFGPYTWSYKDNTEQLVLLCDYYEKKYKRKKLLLLASGQSIMDDMYKKIEKKWKAEKLIPMPAIIAERWVNTVKICRYVCIENDILEYQETDYLSLPILFGAGNMIHLKRQGGAVYDLTRPIYYQAKGAQQLLNCAVQQLGTYIDTLMQAKFLMPIPSVPDEHMHYWKNLQSSSILPYNPFVDNDPTKPIPTPEAVTITPLPPDVMNTVQMCQGIIQATMGAYDNNMAKVSRTTDANASAMEHTMSIANSAATPYLEGMRIFMQGVADRFLELTPLVKRLPQTLPIRTPEGDAGYIKVNGDGQVSLNYDPEELNIKLSAGPAFALQQREARDQLLAIGQLYPEFIETKCMNLFLDNYNFRHIEKMKMLATEYQKEKSAQAQAEAEAMANMPNPEQMKNETANKKIDSDMQLEQMKIGQKDMQVKLDNLVKMRELDMQQQQHQVEMLKTLTEIAVNKADKDSTHLEKAIELTLQTAQANQVENEEAEEVIENKMEE